VVATARDPRSLADLDVSQRLALDVTDDASVTAAFATAGDVDIVIVNPAEIFYAAVEAIPLTELQRPYNLNIVGAIRVAYAELLNVGRSLDGMITPEQVAAEVADAAEKPQLPLRIPIGDAARTVLAGRHAAPDDVPFVPTAG
jgi:hypothetical protein